MRRSSRRSNRKAPQGKNMAAANNDLFWDIGNFKKTVKRVDDGAVVCDDILKMVGERADIESKYAKKLTVWEEKWRKQTQNGPMYATMKNAFSGVLSEAQERAKIHMDCYGKLHNQIIESVKVWKTQTFHKHFMGYWKETKEVDEEFTKAQKPWAEGYNKVQRAKRNYHSACSNLENASQTLSAATKDENFAPEKVKKLEDTVNKQENNVARSKKKYQEKLRRLEPLTTSYEIEMKKVFDKCQQREEKKLDFFQNMLVDYHKCINISADSRLGKLFKEQLESAKSGDVKHDLVWWAENYGADMPKNWPSFEDSIVSSWMQKRHCSICTENNCDSDCPANCFSVATINIGALDAELDNFSQQDLKAVAKVTNQATNHEPSAATSSTSSSSGMLGPLFDSSYSKEDHSYTVYSDFYRNKGEFVQQLPQNVDGILLEGSDNCRLLSTYNDSAVLEKERICDTYVDIPKKESGLFSNEAFEADDILIQPEIPWSSVGVEQHMSLSACSENLLNQKVDSASQISAGNQSKHFQNTMLDEYSYKGSSLEPGEAPSPSFSENTIVDKTNEIESTYQVPKRQESIPPTFASYNGGDNPFSSDQGGNSRSDDEWDDTSPTVDDGDPGVPVRALYTYTAVEDDELSFKSGDVFAKLSEEDAQGWCRGRVNGKTGLYPANYVESV